MQGRLDSGRHGVPRTPRAAAMAAAVTRVAALCLALGLAGCGGGGSNGGASGAVTLGTEIAAAFPFTPDQPLDQLFACTRNNSVLSYYFGFSPNGALEIFFETNTQQQVRLSGTYTHSAGAIRMLALNNNVLPLDETTTVIVPHMGMVGEFDTPGMHCGVVAHGYNDPATETFKSYACPTINAGAASSEANVFELADSSGPFGITFRGGVFRQREVDVAGNPQPIITRGTGIYRRLGDTFYADFGNQFADHRFLKGSFGNADQQLLIEQLEPAAGPCTRR